MEEKGLGAPPPRSLPAPQTLRKQAERGSPMPVWEPSSPPSLSVAPQGLPPRGCPKGFACVKLCAPPLGDPALSEDPRRHSPACPVSPPGLERAGPGGGYLGHRLRPSLRSAVAGGGGAGALRVPSLAAAARSPAALETGAPGRQRLLKVPALAPPRLWPGARPPRSPRVGDGGLRLRVPRWTREAGKGQSLFFDWGMGVRGGVSRSSPLRWQRDEAAGGQGEPGPAGRAARAELGVGGSLRPAQVIFLRGGGGARPRLERRGEGRGGEQGEKGSRGGRSLAGAGRGLAGAGLGWAGPVGGAGRGRILATTGPGCAAPEAERDPVATDERR